MVIYYKNRFVKVFSVALIVAILVAIGSAYSFRNIENLSPDSENFLFIKLMPWAVLVSFGLNVWSCYLLAKAKGYSGWLALLAFLNIIGLALLFLLSDKSRS